MKLLTFFFLVLMTAIYMGCESRRENFNPEELYGSYLAVYADDTDKLEVKSDGVYIHEYRKGSEVKKEIGTWEFVEAPSGSAMEIDIVFNDFKFRFLKGISSSRGDWFTSAAKTTEDEKSKIYLCFQTELHLCFIKQ